MSGNNLKVSGIINLPSLGSLSGGKLLCPEQYIEGFASVPVRIVENRPRVPLLNSIEPSIGWSHPLTKKGDACSLPTWQAADRQRITNLFPTRHRLVFVASNRQRIA